MTRILEDTKERALPGHPAQTLEDYLVYLKHVALYDFAKTFGAGKSVLDLGCGEGYGSDALARAAHSIVAADYSFDVVAHAQEKYAHGNLAFVVCDAHQLPFRPACFDVVISFEVIEHIANVHQYLGETKRVRAEAGVCLFSTPNRLLRLLPFQKPWNRFHKREYDARGLASVLRRLFGSVQVRGVTATPAILQIEKQRVKQSPVTAYSKMVAQMLLPSFVYERLKNAKSKRQPLGTAIDFSRTKFSAGDFRISENDLRECITLVATCRE